MKALVFLLLTFFVNLFFYLNPLQSENISEEKYYEIVKEAKVFYKGIDRNSLGTDGDCVWDYHSFGSEWFNIQNQQYKFDDTIFYSLGCVFGMYNYWSVWIKEK